MTLGELSPLETSAGDLVRHSLLPFDSMHDKHMKYALKATSNHVIMCVNCILS